MMMILVVYLLGQWNFSSGSNLNFLQKNQFFWDSVIRLSLGSKLLVNQLQVVKRTNTPLLPQQMASSTDHGFLGRGFDPHHPQ